jgi:hypothetical protein
MKHFLYRLAQNSIPLKMSLKRRGIDTDTRCLVCMRLDKDGGHCFLKCKFICKCWQAMEMEQTRLELVEMRPSREVVQYVLEMEEIQRQKCVILLCFGSDGKQETR